MKPIVTYECEICNKKHKDPESAIECEKVHLIPKKIVGYSRYECGDCMNFPRVIEIEANGHIARYCFNDYRGKKIDD